MSIFQAGYQRRDYHFTKQYYPFIYRNGKRRYAGRGRLHFCTATLAMNYALRWAARAKAYLDAGELDEYVEYLDITVA